MSKSGYHFTRKRYREEWLFSPAYGVRVMVANELVSLGTVAKLTDGSWIGKYTSTLYLEHAKQLTHFKRRKDAVRSLQTQWGYRESQRLARWIGKQAS